MVIDVHAHAVFPAALGLAAGNAAADEAQRVENATFGAEAVRVNQAQIQRIGPLLTQLDARYATMDGMGVDVQLVSPSPVHYHDWAEPALAQRITRTVNEGVTGLLSARLLGLGVVPLQHPSLAVDELTAALEMGLKGVEISTSAGGRELADPALEPFWARAEELETVVFIHPWGCSLGPRLDRHYLANTVGQPTETTLALSHLIFSGLLDRRPNLRVIAAHGGGYLPFYIGRSNHAWRARPDAKTPRREPAEYLRRLFFDSLVYEPDALRALVAKAGADRVLLGTDFPFDMGVEDPLERLRGAGLEPATEKAIAGGNAAKLLGLDALR